MTEARTTGRIRRGRLRTRNRARFLRRIGRMRDGEVELIVRRHGATRSAAQNAWYFAGIVTPLAEHTGYDVDEMHQLLKQLFLSKALAVCEATAAAHVAQNSGEHEWYTPRDYIEAARAVMGGIDCDPASSASANAIVQATQFYTRDDDGLAQPWRGRVWMNPPYAHLLVDQFCERLAAHVSTGTVTEAVVLVNNATETRWFARLAAVAAAICFPLGRVRFWSPGHDTAAPLQGQAVVYVGAHVTSFLREFGAFGLVVTVA